MWLTLVGLIKQIAEDKLNKKVGYSKETKQQSVLNVVKIIDVGIIIIMNEVTIMGNQDKHTPGPWEVKNLTDVFTTLGAQTRKGIKAADNDGWLIADCANGITFDVEGQERTIVPREQAANARLIAAAPDMLAALEEVEWENDGYCNMYCPCCDNYQTHGHKEECKLGNALKKARGNS